MEISGKLKVFWSDIKLALAMNSYNLRRSYFMSIKQLTVMGRKRYYCIWLGNGFFKI